MVGTGAGRGTADFVLVGIGSSERDRAEVTAPPRDRALASDFKGGVKLPPDKELNMTDDCELAKRCAFDARTLPNDVQGKGHIDELKLLKAMQLLVNTVQALAAEK